MKRYICQNRVNPVRTVISIPIHLDFQVCHTGNVDCDLIRFCHAPDPVPAVKKPTVPVDFKGSFTFGPTVLFPDNSSRSKRVVFPADVPDTIAVNIIFACNN